MTSSNNTKPFLSKSRFMAGSQCHLKLWYETYARELETETDDVTQAIFDTGHEVGELACQKYPGGYLIRHDHLHVEEALEETSKLLASDTPSTLFEPAFRHRDVLVRVDILERLDDGTWGLIEVKSTTGTKPTHEMDVAIQLWVLRGSGLDVSEAGVLTLNPDYVYGGGEHDLDALFKLHPVLDTVEAHLANIGDSVSEMQSMLGSSSAPEIAPGKHCFNPYHCQFFAHCTRDFEQPDHGIDELWSLKAAPRAALEAAEVSEIRDIAEDFPLSPTQKIIRQAVLESTDLLHGDLQGELAKIEQPVYYLDFETCLPAIPRFIGTSPYQQIPFLFSVHLESNGHTEHIDYLHETNDDPRSTLTERLIEALGTHGSICVYSSFEDGVLNQLSKALPEKTAELSAIRARLFDLFPVVRNNYYHPDFRGSFSIKNVLPVVVPTSGYDDLSIADGQTASVHYVQAVDSSDSATRRQTFEDLRAYCERDTLALVELRGALTKLAERPISNT